MDFGYVSLEGSKPDLQALVNAHALGFDTETTGVKADRDYPLGFSVACSPYDAYYTNMYNGFMTGLIADDNITKISHNAKFDRSMFKKCGIEINNMCCTMVAAQLLEEPRLSLKDLLKAKIKGQDLKIKFFEDFNKPIKEATLQEMAMHFGPHSSAALMLWNVLQYELRRDNLWNVFWNIEMPVIPVLSDMELNGTMIDVPYLDELGKYLDSWIYAYGEYLAHLSGHTNINWNSPDQTAHYMYGEMGLPKPMEKKKASAKKSKHPSVDKKYLIGFQDTYPVIKYYLRYKNLVHLKGTYVTGIGKRLVNGRIHTNFNQTRTRTGRLSSSDPNLQNIPMRSELGRKVRLAFIAPQGKSIVKADMDQMELKKMACLSNCKPLLDAFRNHEDVHGTTAMHAYGDIARRPDGKTLNFKLIYGGGTPEQQAILFQIYPDVKQWSDSMLEQFQLLGFAQTHYGRRQHLPHINSSNRMEVAHAHRQGISTMDQGSCSEYLKISMRKIWNKIKNTDIKMLLQVHDELVFECPDELVEDFSHELARDMQYNELQIPLTATVSVGKSWGDTKKFISEKL